MGAVFYPLMFFAGLHHPVQLLPGVRQDISHCTSLPSFSFCETEEAATIFGLNE